MKQRRYIKLFLVFIVTLTLWFPGIESHVSALENGSISGTVYEADGTTPIQGVFVTVSGGGYFADACTDVSGNFFFEGPPLDAELLVQAAPPWANCSGSWTDHVHEFWQETRDKDSASLVVLTSANPNRTGIDFTLDQGGVISGTVYAADGVTPLPHIAVSFHNDGNTYNAAVCTDDSGQYAFHGAPLDMPLRVRTDSYRDSWCDSGGDYLPEYWEEAPDSASAAVITLTEAASSQSGIDFTIDTAGSISGAVYGVDGVTPIPNLLVTILGNGQLGPSECTDGSGQYTIHNVPFDTPLYVYVQGAPTWCGNTNTYGVEFYDEAADLSGAVPLTVSEANNQLTGIDFTVEAITIPSPDPFLRAWHVDDSIEVDYWPVGTHLTLEIEDPATPAFPDFSAEMDTSADVDAFDLNGQFDVQPGMFVVVSGASITKVLLVDPVTITNVDPEAETITGSASPNSWMWMFFADSCCRSTVADGTGLWTFDYSVPGADGEPVADIRPGSEGAVHVPSGDGSTSVLWRVPAKTLHVVPKYPEVHGHDWPANTDVTLVVDDDQNPGNGTLHTEIKNTDDDPWCGSPCFDLSGILDLDKDLYVSLTDGIDTKTVQISPLEITSINLSTNTISGRADPGSRVAVNIWSQGGIARYVTTAGNGTWIANFSVAGDEDFEQEKADLQAGDNGRAIQLNPDGSDDGTLEYWTAELPVVDSILRASANPTNAATVDFTVTFSDTVNGVDVSDFTLTKPGLTGTSVTKVIGSGDTYTVTVKTGSGNGTLRLNLVDNDSIRSELNIPLGGPGTGNGNFITGEEYMVARSAPGAPVLLSPAAEELIDDLQPTFDWKDSSPAADHYQLQVAMSSNFSSLVLNETDIVGSTFAMPAELLPGKIYYWRVRGLNVLDLAGGWSIVRAFKTPLAQPELVAPAMDAVLTTDRPTFAWNPVDGATQYNLQVSASANFGTLMVNATVTGVEYTATKDLPQNKTLFWRVRAKSPAVAGPWSLKRSFKSGNPPTVPVLAAPANGALSKDYTPRLNWSDSGIPAGTIFARYELQVDDQNDFSSPVIEESITDMSDFTLVSNLPANTRFYWRVRAVNTDNVTLADHTSGWSPVWSFRTIIPAPTGLTVLPNGLKPTFDWNDASGPGTIKSYTIQISANAQFSSFLINTTSPVSLYTMLKNLPAGKTLHWRVRVNGENGPSGWTTTQYTTPAP